MVDPINYSGLLPQIDLSPLTQGLQLRQVKKRADADFAAKQQTIQLAREKFEVDQQKDADYLKAVEAYKDAPTPQALRDLSIRFPEQAERLTKAADSYTQTQKQDLIGAGFGALGAISAGNVPLAIDTLQKRSNGLKNSGIDTSHTDAAIQMLKDGKTKEATAYLSYAMGGLVGADHAAGVLETLGVGGKAEDRRADNARADRMADIAERRAANAERATTAAIAGREHDDARADRKAAGGGKKGGKKGAYTNAQLDALIG